MKRSMFATFLLAGVTAFTGCKEEQAKGPGAGAAAPAQPATKVAPEDHANAVDLGQKTVGALTLKAKQDEPIKAGGEGAFDLLVTGGKPKAVRFWVGVESGEGSVKGKAAEESPDNWHTHVEVPDPLPPGSKFWAEVEPAQGEKFVVGFDLKQ